MKKTDLAPLPVNEWDKELSYVVDDMNGKPINVHCLMANNPELLKAWWSFRNYSVNGGALGQRKGELVILRVAIHMQAWYEWGSHVDRSLSCGITPDEIKRVNQKVPDNRWSADEALLLLAVDKLIEEQKIPEDMLEELGNYYNSSQIMDLMAIHGMYVILACMINTWGLELDKHVAARIKGSISVDEAVPSLN